MVFSGLCPLVVEDVVDEGERIGVRARTPQDMALCPVCGVSSGRVHGYHWRTVDDAPVDGEAGGAPCGGAAAPGVPHAWLPTYLPRPGARSARPIPAAHHSSDQASQGRGQGVSGPGRGTFAGDTRGGRLASYRSAYLVAYPAARSADAPRDRRRRLRSAPAPPLCHRAGRTYNRRAPRPDHPGTLAPGPRSARTGREPA